MRFLWCLLLLLAVACKDPELNQREDPNVVNVFHYNIKELDSTKLSERNRQVKAVKNIISRYEIDILSINEIQYDLPNIPNSQYVSRGENMLKLGNLLNLNQLNESSFYQANTGNDAQKRKDGSYEVNPQAPRARGLADMINFGIFPGQYSTGALFRYKKIKESIVTNIKWKEFNPEREIQKFTTADGETLPNDMPLFDKNFSDISLDINGKTVHLILLHTVPSFHFGNKSSPNYVRNQDQMRFLEWYLTGETDIEVGIKGIEPLPEGSYFIAVGDWNVDLKSKDSPGRANLQNILNKTNPWINPSQFTFTNESSSFAKNPYRLMLDYLVVSKNIQILEGETVLPKFDREELGCFDMAENKRIKKKVKGKTQISYTNKSKSKKCFALIDQDYHQFKIASDHFPLWAKIKLLD